MSLARLDCMQGRFISRKSDLNYWDFSSIKKEKGLGLAIAYILFGWVCSYNVPRQLLNTKPISQLNLKSKIQIKSIESGKIITKFIDVPSNTYFKLEPSQRRICACGELANEERRKWLASENAVFILPEEIIDVDRMRFVSSPFKERNGLTKAEEEQLFKKAPRMIKQFKQLKELGQLEERKRQQLLAKTEDGRHIVLQPAVASCVIASASMLALDKGIDPKKIDWDEVSTTHFSTGDRAIRFLEKAGLACSNTKLDFSNMDQAIRTLQERIKEHGSGIIEVGNRKTAEGQEIGIDGHAIVLDEISLEDQYALIRDPFHGWSIKISLDAFKGYLANGNENFIQVI